jgi:hypothetical protein
MPFRKRWCWLGAFGPEAMLCVAWAQVGVARVSWWAVWDGTALREGYRRSWRGVRVDAAGARVDGVLSLRVSRGRAIEARTGDTWTRKTPVRVEGFVHGRGFSAAGLLDESEGRHARHTAWLWSAGVGPGVAWNFCDGLHDGENTVWVDGEPHAVGVPRFHGLAGVGDLRFAAEATRARKENLVLIASDYEQPFGTFTGSLPVAGELRSGWGVMERHEARW